MITAAWVLRKANLEDSGLLVDIAIDGGKIKAIGQNLPIRGNEEWDLSGLVVLPAFVDAHVHLDQTLSTSFNKSGTLIEANELWNEEKRRLTYERYFMRALQAQNIAITYGTTALRTHVDVYSSGFWLALEAILDARKRQRDLITVQIVALGKGGNNPQDEKALQQALKMGADLIGGSPAFTPNPKKSIDTLFDLAELHDKSLDLHVDEVDDGRIMTLEYLAEKTLERGFKGRVTAGHCNSLSFADDATADRVMDKVKEAEINIVTLPSADMVQMGRGLKPSPRGLTPVKELLGRSINVAAASDKVRDSFNPLGSYDLLQTANLLAHASQLTGTHEIPMCLEMVTTRAASVLGLKEYGLFEGAEANLVVVNSKNLTDTLASVPERLGIFRKGQLVLRTVSRRVWTEGLVWT
ncbi:MAG: amidohydrolase family protein [Trueperaceae bacterium]|nr:amidohydrolase family protein [Trueperaceae bacterium]